MFWSGNNKADEMERRAYEDELARSIASSELFAAQKGFELRAERKLLENKTNLPKFKIERQADGSFFILVRNAKAPEAPKKWLTFIGTINQEDIDFVRESSADPIYFYIPVKNPDQPGHPPMMFNFFEEAESYLMKMTSTSDDVVEYDFPPLMRRGVA